METLTEKINYQGKSLPQVLAQLNRMATGFPFLRVDRPAQAHDGIRVLTEHELDTLGQNYCRQKDQLDIVKFVPASGAASRMFKKLHEFLQSNGFLSDHPDAATFIKELKKFAFYQDLDKSLAEKGTYVDLAIQDKDFKLIISRFLENDGLGYGQLPKGLLKFHRYETHERTPVHEHMVEGIHYAIGMENTIKLHFTVSEEHHEGFEKEVRRIKEILEEEHKVNMEVTFSYQKPETDTIAVNLDNTPFLNDDGTVLFRPGGHGALLSNLEEIEADLIFIKNIDNVAGEQASMTSKRYKMAMAGLLLQVQAQLVKLLNGLKAGAAEVKEEAENFLNAELAIRLPQSYWNASVQEQVNYLIGKMERPIRVCGMVRNTGEPGGGPFWAWNADGSLSLQIAEKAQLSPEDQHVLLAESTHFNPVDIVCAIKKADGTNYELRQFADEEAGLISEKSLNGKALKALELPGLWNGGMSDWNTLFVEVPLVTFTPVKTINDLLKDVHQNT